MCSGLFGAAVSAQSLLFIGSVLYVLYSQSPWAWTDLIRGYNAFLGPFVQYTVVQILALFNLAFKGLVPFLNCSVFFTSRVTQGYLLPTLVQEADTVAELGLAVLGLIKSLCVSLLNWLLSAMVDCPASNGDACFDLGPQTLDVVTPTADVRNSVVAGVAFAGNVCTTLSPVLDIVTYPFMDLNFATGLHNLVNTVLFLLVQIPDMTYLRCLRYGGEGPLMRAPDLEPFFAFRVLVAGLTRPWARSSTTGWT